DFLSGEVPRHEWSAHAKTILNNLTCEAIPKVATESMSVLQEEGITSSEVNLPRETKMRDSIRALVKRSAISYAASKRGPMSRQYVESLVDAYRERYAAGGRIRHMTEKYVVLDPI